jgi:hypothetical protein
MGRRIWLVLLGGVGFMVATARKFGVKVFGAKPRAILSIYAPQHLPSGWQTALGDYDALSMRLLSPGMTSDSSVYYEAARQAGCSAHGWGYQYLNSFAQADKELARLKIQIPKYGVVCYWLNAETQFWNSPDPVAYAVHFVKRFRQEFPGVGLAWNGYSGARKFGIGFVQMFDVWGPMAYGTKEGGASVHPKITTLVKIANEAGVISAPTVTGGHIRPNVSGSGRGQYWGYFFASKGLLAAYQAAPFEWINYWHGAIPGRSTILTGNAKNPSQSEQIRILRGGGASA